MKNSLFDNIGRTPDPIFYLSAIQNPPERMTLHLRFARDAYGVASALRAKVHSLDPSLAPTSVSLMSEAVAANGMFLPRVLSLLSGGFALIALVLAVVGLYGVVSFTVSRRTQEIGVRIALGATRGSVLAMVMRNGLSAVAIGLLLGLAAALALTPLMAHLLNGVNPRDPQAFLAIATLLLTAAVAASWIPARRAASVDPLTALRYE